MVASSEPSLTFKSINCFQLPSAYCYLSSFYFKKLALNLLLNFRSPLMFRAKIKTKIPFNSK